jgi:hypothetical protein
MRKLFVGIAAAVLATFVVAAAPNADAATARRHRANHFVSQHGRMYSTNWSGFALPAKSGERITAVTGSWNVPLIRPVPPGQSSSWIGIGGFDTSDLIQVGTSSNGRLDDSYAWFEMLPDYETRILSGCARDASCSLSPGDHMAASVTNNGGDNWTIMLANLGDGVHAKWYWGQVVTYRSTLSSAEWVFEAPQTGVVIGGIPVLAQTMPANAPHARFTGGTYTLNGVTQALRPWVAQRIFMPTATPSPMAPDGHFRVCAYKLSCTSS